MGVTVLTLTLIAISVGVLCVRGQFVGVGVTLAPANACTVQEEPPDASAAFFICLIEPTRADLERNAINVSRWRERFSMSFAQSESAYLKHRFHLAANGSLYQTAPIDREELCGLLQLCCTPDARCDIPLRLRLAGAGKLALISASIALIDANDNAPKFDQNQYDFEILESVPIGTQIPLKLATDADSRENNVERYEWTGKSQPKCPFELKFNRSNVSGRHSTDITELYLVTTAKLDRETTPSYEFTLFALDKGQPQLTGSAEIRIVLADINDNSPQFPRAVYSETIAENMQPSVTIMRLSASDPDDSVNGDIEYSLRGEPHMLEKFAIDQFSGALHLTDSLDFERQREYRFLVVATDRSLTNALTGQAQVVINVTNVNDAAPRIELELITDQADKQVVELSETTPVGTLVGLFQVQDDDSPSVQCTLLNSPKFRLTRSASNSSEYRIITTSLFDREASAVEHITIHCIDQGDRLQLTGSATIRVDITDENDCTPEFVLEPNPQLAIRNGVLHLQVTENNNPGDLLVDLRAVDRDENQNSRLTYSLVADGAECCRIESDGRLMATRMFDREEQSAYRLRAEVCDGGATPRCAQMHIQLNVVDVNDNAPSWKLATLTLNVSEATHNGSMIGVFEVRDNDVAENAEFDLAGPFPISSNDYTDVRNTFRLVNRSLYIVKPLDRETIQTYYFVLSATDHGYQRMTSSATVTLHVIDTNDHSPTVEFRAVRNNTVRISYAELPGTTVCDLSVYDHDLGENALLHMSIEAGNELGLFEIRPTTKLAQRRDSEYVSVSVAKVMSRANIGNHSMSIMVRDSGMPPRSVVVPLTVIIESGEPRERPFNRLPLDVEDAQKALNELLWTKPVLLICFIAVTTILLFSVIAFLYFRFLYHPDRDSSAFRKSRKLGRRNRATDETDAAADAEYPYEVALRANDPCLMNVRRCTNEPKRMLRVEADLNSHRPIRTELSREREMSSEPIDDDTCETSDARLYDLHLPVYRSPLEAVHLGIHMGDFEPEYTSSVRSASTVNRMRTCASLEELENNNNNDLSSAQAAALTQNQTQTQSLSQSSAQAQSSPNDAGSMNADETAARLFLTPRRRSRSPSPVCSRGLSLSLKGVRYQGNSPLTASAAECDFQPKVTISANASDCSCSCSHTHDCESRTFNCTHNIATGTASAAAREYAFHGHRSQVQRPAYTDRFATATVGRKSTAASNTSTGNDISKKYVSTFESPSSFV